MSVLESKATDMDRTAAKGPIETADGRKIYRTTISQVTALFSPEAAIGSVEHGHGDIHITTLPSESQLGPLDQSSRNNHGDRS